MTQWLNEMLEQSSFFMPHGHCYLWIPSLLWLHVISDLLIGAAYFGISLTLYVLVRKIRLPFSPLFISFGLFIGLCGITHFVDVWTVWNPDYWTDGLIKGATAAASVATAVGLFFAKPRVEEFVHTARLSEERRIRLESTHAELESLYRKIKELDEVKTRFFANVSHELRTPLALILGPAEQMLGDSNLTPAQRRHLESIGRNGKTLLKQVNDLLDVSKLEAQKMEVKYARLDVAAWFQRIASQFDVAAEQRGLQYGIDCPESLRAEVDPDMLERVFINLLSNAFKFTPGGGAIHVSLAHGEDAFQFRVTDTGPGIRPDQRESIFERFHQVEGQANRTHGGTGLGLAIAKDFVDLHGGRIEVGASEGGGAAFTVTLPYTAPAHTVVDEAPHTLAPTTQVALDGALEELRAEAESTSRDTGVVGPHVAGRPDVLLVEDNQAMRTFVADILGVHYNVATASDGEEGLIQAQALLPDLIISDVMMPRMSGDQLVSSVRMLNALDATPILLLTAKSDDALRVKLLQGGAQDYLTKPFLAQELLVRTSNLIATKRAGDTLRRELSSLSGNLEEMAGELSFQHRQLQVALEAADVARDQAERASQVKSHFLAMVSHEMRTPLSTIQMNLDLLLRQQTAVAPEALRPRLDRLVRASRQMSTLIEGLLEYTRVESGRIDVRCEEVDPVKLAEDVLDAHRDGVSPTIRLVLDPPPKTLPMLTSDARLLRVVLSNLVSNALKFTSEGTIALRLATSGGDHVFEVHDTGIGIPEADIPRIFRPFEQLEPIQRKSIPGVGLGLALVKRIVDALGGRVEVRSVVGSGSTFTIVLRSEPPPAPSVTSNLAHMDLE